jgi:ankyrin repeat protein
MRRGNLSVCIFILILFVSCSSTNQENETTSINEEALDNQAVVEVKEPANNIWVSAKKGDIESIKQHIAYGTDLNSKGSSRDETALIIASCQGHFEIVDLLINNDVDLNIQNDEGVTAQFCAVFFGQTEIVQLLKDAGADPNIIMNQDLTAMDLVSVEWDSDRESAVKFYKLKYQVSFDVEDIKSAHPLIMDILNK